MNIATHNDEAIPTSIGTNELTTSTPSPSVDMKTTVLIVHGLYALGMLTGITALVGVILAYVKRADAQGTVYESHITYAIRTFWIGVTLLVTGIVLTFVLVGTVILALSTVWYLIRLVRAFVAAIEGRAIARPTGFF